MLRTRVPIGAVPRSCECGQIFRAMTGREWENVRRVHELTSERHRLSKSHAREMDNDVSNRAAPGRAPIASRIAYTKYCRKISTSPRVKLLPELQSGRRALHLTSSGLSH